MSRRLRDALYIDEEMMTYFQENPIFFNALRASIKLKKKAIEFNEHTASLGIYEIFSLIKYNLDCIFKETFPEFKEEDNEDTYFELICNKDLNKESHLLKKYHEKFNRVMDRAQYFLDMHRSKKTLEHSNYYNTNFTNKEDCDNIAIFIKDIKIYVNNFLLQFDKDHTFDIKLEEYHGCTTLTLDYEFEQ